MQSAYKSDMAPRAVGNMPSMRKRHLQSEFAGLKQACPEGIYASSTPSDATTWSAVLFVRDGPYAPAILRFQISFPDTYPRLPPLVTFASDIFHPLITPLTTYTYTTDIQDNGTVSATDEERLPPGGFSLRHGFPDWFGRGHKVAETDSRRNSNGSNNAQDVDATSPTAGSTKTGLSKTPDSTSKPNYMTTRGAHTSAYDVLKYIRSSFDTEEVIDSIPLSAAGNPGAWHAWRSHRRKLGKLPPKLSEEGQTQREPKQEQSDGTSRTISSLDRTKSPPPLARRPSQWNWEGVWEDRVKKGIAMSLSEPVLYGGAATTPQDELIRFLPLETGEIDSIKENIRRTLGNSGASR